MSCGAVVGRHRFFFSITRFRALCKMQEFFSFGKLSISFSKPLRHKHRRKWKWTYLYSFHWLALRLICLDREDVRRPSFVSVLCTFFGFQIKCATFHISSNNRVMWLRTQPHFSHNVYTMDVFVSP